jgi:glucose/arabinose dehydrogenase
VDRRSGEAEVFAGGFTNIMDLAFDRRGTLWVLEIDHDSLLTPDPADGAIYAVDRSGNKKQLELPAGTLTHPGGITVGKDGALYVTNHGDTAGNGEVVKIEVKKRGHHGHGHHGHRGHHHGHGHHGHGRGDGPKFGHR